MWIVFKFVRNEIISWHALRAEWQTNKGAVLRSFLWVRLTLTNFEAQYWGMLGTLKSICVKLMLNVPTWKNLKKIVNCLVTSFATKYLIQTWTTMSPTFQRNSHTRIFFATLAQFAFLMLESYRKTWWRIIPSSYYRTCVANWREIIKYSIREGNALPRIIIHGIRLRVWLTHFLCPE